MRTDDRQGSSGRAPVPAAGQRTYKVGQRLRRWHDTSRPNWAAPGARPLRTVLWYPADDTAQEVDVPFGASEPLFVVRSVATDAPLRASPVSLPVVVMSHGTGGSALQLGWLGRALAARGYVAAAVDHHGNTSSEPYLPQGFLLWWERARDLSAVLDAMLADPIIGHRLDATRIGAAGFSLGGLTAVMTLGGRCSLDRVLAVGRQRFENDQRGPREFPDVDRHWHERMANDPVFRASVAAHARSYRDARVRAAFVMNPALGAAFDATGLATVEGPVHVVVTEGDEEAPPQLNGCRYADLIADSQLTLVRGPAGHYVFLAEATAAGALRLPSLCLDHAVVDRRAVHEHVAALAATFFARHLDVEADASA